ncbi:hypothetical protein Goarm_005771, partial [Gossypium armourianum]|nr:hypothetical protein [Gossypium armourianum]
EAYVLQYVYKLHPLQPKISQQHEIIEDGDTGEFTHELVTDDTDIPGSVAGLVYIIEDGDTGEFTHEPVTDDADIPGSIAGLVYRPRD